MGWWFGRIMTFEVIDGASAPTVSSILSDASAGTIAADSSRTVVGYAAYGASIASAVQPLVDYFDIPLFDDGSMLRPPLDSSPLAIGADELGNSADGHKAAKLQREQTPVRDVPSTLRLTYYDPDRDYQSGEARASTGDQSNDVQQDLPAVLSANDAKALVQQMLARQWSRRDSLTLRLPPARIAIEPGAIVQPGLSPAEWRVQTSTVDGFVTVLELHPSWQPQPQLVAEAGRIIANSDIVEAPTSLALIDAPNLSGAQASGPTVLIAASSPNPGWSGRPLTLDVSGQTIATQTAAAKSVLGFTSSVLASADPHLIDLANSVEVGLVDPQQWLTSCDDDALADGLNLAAIGSELVQFGDVTPLANGRFQLSRLLRGRGGTEWATATHKIGEGFCLVGSNGVRAIAIPAWSRGSTAILSDRSGSTASLNIGAESARPLSPVNVAAQFDSGGNLMLSWTRRSRSGFAWLDEVDAPVGESREQYLVTVTGAAASFETTAADAAVLVTSAELAPLGSGAAIIEIRQVGDWAASRPSQVSINLP